MQVTETVKNLCF